MELPARLWWAVLLEEAGQKESFCNADEEREETAASEGGFAPMERCLDLGSSLMLVSNNEVVFFFYGRSRYRRDGERDG